MSASVLDQATLRSLVHYDPESGIFTWLSRKGDGLHVRKWNGKLAGKVAGSKSDGYILITVLSRKYKAHRLAWLYVYGTNPESEVDHINRVRMDNRISNLRLATKDENQFNVVLPRKHNVSGVKGAKWCPRDGNFMARIVVGGKEIYLGKFSTAEAAGEAYIAAHIKYANEYSPYSVNGAA